MKCDMLSQSLSGQTSQWALQVKCPPFFGQVLVLRLLPGYMNRTTQVPLSGKDLVLRHGKEV